MSRNERYDGTHATGVGSIAAHRAAPRGRDGIIASDFTMPAGRLAPCPDDPAGDSAWGDFFRRARRARKEWTPLQWLGPPQYGGRPYPGMRGWNTAVGAPPVGLPGDIAPPCSYELLKPDQFSPSLINVTGWGAPSWGCDGPRWSEAAVAEFNHRFEQFTLEKTGGNGAGSMIYRQIHTTQFKVDETTYKELLTDEGHFHWIVMCGNARKPQAHFNWLVWNPDEPWTIYGNDGFDTGGVLCGEHPETTFALFEFALLLITPKRQRVQVKIAGSEFDAGTYGKSVIKASARSAVWCGRFPEDP